MHVVTPDPASPAAIEFRAVRPGDERLLLSLLEGIDPTFFRPHAFTEDEVARISSHVGRDLYAMLLEDGQPMAYGLLRGLDEGYPVPSLGVAVRSEARRRGYARRTVAAIHQEARRRGIGAVRLRVHEENGPARRLYESFGYRYDGEDRGELVMRLELGPVDAAGRPAASERAVLSRGAGLFMKRLIDLVGAALGLVVLSPVLAWVALALVLSQGRPIFFRQRRPGRSGRPFTIIKFRTMRSPARGEVWYLTDDARVTRLGRFLRSSSIDELPELWNVLRGEMSLVGPRPLLEEYLDVYTPEEHRRHAMRPGVTSWAAVNGRHVLGFRERLQLDVWYIDHWGLRLDFRIMIATVRQVIRGTDVAATQDLAAIGFPLAGLSGATADDAASERPTQSNGGA